MENIQEIIKKSTNLKHIKTLGGEIFFGEFNEKPLILTIMCKSKKELPELTNFNKLFENDRFYKFDGSTLYPLTISLIYPALEEDFKKIIYKEKIRKTETFQTYLTEVFPKIKNQDLTWIDEIINGKKEQESIIFQNDDFILLPDLKWDTNDINELYCLVIVKHKNLRSIRDLNSNHIKLLEDIESIGCTKIQEKYKISKNMIRIYFHYHPSFWQLHIHFNLISSLRKGASIDVSHQLNSVINNIKLCPEYYQKIELDIIEYI